MLYYNNESIDYSNNTYMVFCTGSKSCCGSASASPCKVACRAMFIQEESHKDTGLHENVLNTCRHADSAIPQCMSKSFKTEDNHSSSLAQSRLSITTVCTVCRWRGRERERGKAGARAGRREREGVKSEGGKEKERG